MSNISGIVTLKTVSAPFEGGRILQESDFFKTRCLGVIFYLGELLSKVLFVGFYKPVSEWFKDKAISIRIEEDERVLKIYSDRIDPNQSIEFEEEFDEEVEEFESVKSDPDVAPPKMQENEDQILKSLIPEIDQKVEEIHQKYRQRILNPNELGNTISKLITKLRKFPHLKGEKMLEQRKEVFHLFMSKLSEKIDVKKELQIPKTPNTQRFLLSIQRKRIIH